MSAPANAKQELIELVETLSNEDAERFLDYINMCLDPDELTPEEQEAVLEAMAAIDAGEVVTQEEVEREFRFKG